MAVGVYLELPGVTQEQYDAVADRLTDGRGLNSRSDWPVEGLILHVAGPMEGGWRVLDVWESEEAFERFSEHLAPGMAQVGIGGGSARPITFPIHNLVTE